MLAADSFRVLAGNGNVAGAGPCFLRTEVPMQTPTDHMGDDVRLRGSAPTTQQAYHGAVISLATHVTPLPDTLDTLTEDRGHGFRMEVCATSRLACKQRHCAIQTFAETQGAERHSRPSRFLLVPSASASCRTGASAPSATQVAISCAKSHRVQATGHQRCTASAVSNGPVLKHMRACGACSCTTLSTFSNRRKFLSMVRTPAPITTQS